MPPKAKTPTAPERVRTWLDEMRSGRLASGKVHADRSAAQAEHDQLEREHERERRDRLIGKPGADKREAAVAERLSDLRMRIVGLAEDQQSISDLIRERQRLIEQTREREFEQFAAEIEPAIEEYQKLLEKNLPAVEALAAAYQRIEGIWQPLHGAGAKFVTAREEAVGLFRDGGKLSRDTACPPSPLTPKVLDALRTRLPRPPALGPDYYNAEHQQMFADAAEDNEVT